MQRRVRVTDQVYQPGEKRTSKKKERKKTLLVDSGLSLDAFMTVFHVLAHSFLIFYFALLLFYCASERDNVAVELLSRCARNVPRFQPNLTCSRLAKISLIYIYSFFGGTRDILRLYFPVNITALVLICISNLVFMVEFLNFKAHVTETIQFSRQSTNIHRSDPLDFVERNILLADKYPSYFIYKFMNFKLCKINCN